jgi:hypothetical protein
MAYSSTDIASLTGGFGQQVMLQQQQAAMITNQFGGYSPSARSFPVATQGEQFGGMLMNGMGQMGMSALGSQRLNSMGGGIGAPAAQSGQFLLGQMSYGAQQQQMLDVNLRDSYRHPNAFGGRGFSGSETSQIGSSLRQMSHMRGPSGETTSFEELGQLAANMGRMGMAEGVRSAKDFNEKFKTMLSTVKTIATELGTSLEEAQKVMASMKGSGIFRNQGQFASMIRQGALAGNMSQGEMSAAGQMGAQISRSIGGFGKAGAIAGVRTLTNVGSALQAGVLSEEDIYNTTGLTGAEGRQAMAQNMMSGDARFFSGQLGRRALAAMAGKDGKLDQNAVAAFMSGDVGTGETMDRAHGMRGRGVTQANFIRNEGRLRGEALAEFQGLGRAKAAQGWLRNNGSGKNFELEEMDDRSMLLFQRKFNVGRDEADNLIKMARNMDNIMGQRQRSAENDRYLKRAEQQDRAGRPEEIVKQLEMARNKINDGLREVGVSFQRSMSTSIGEFIASMSNDYVQRRRAAMSDIVNGMVHGGTGARMQQARELGLVSTGAGTTVLGGDLKSGGLRQELFGNGKLTDNQFDRFLGSNAQKFREAGYDITKAKSMEDVYAIQRQSYKDGKGIEFNGPGRGSLYATLEKENEEIGRLLLGNRSRYGEEGAGHITETVGQIGGDAALRFGRGSMVGRGITSATEWLSGHTRGIDETINKYTADTADAAKAREGLAEKITMGFGNTSVGRWASRFTKELAGEASTAEAQGTAEYLKSDEGRALGGSIVGRNARSISKTVKNIEDQRRKLLEVTKRSKEEESRLHGLNALAATGKLTQAARDAGGLDKVPTETLNEIARSTGFGGNVDAMLKSAQTAEATIQEERARDQSQAWEGAAQTAREDIESRKESESEVDKSIASGDLKISDDAKEYIKTMRLMRQKQAQLTGETTGVGLKHNLNVMTQITGLQMENETKRGSGKSIQERRKIARDLIAGGESYEGTRWLSELKTEEKLEHGLAREKRGASGSYAEAVAGVLGADFTKGDFKKMTGAVATQELMKRLGLGAGSTVAGREDIERQLSKVMSKDTPQSERARLLTELAGRKELVEAKSKDQDAKAAANDPSYRKLGEIKDALEGVKQATGSVASALERPLTVTFEEKA